MLEKRLDNKISRSKFNSLNGLNFKIDPGELIAIVGPVGCGKTTLAKSIEEQLRFQRVNYF